MVSKWNIRPEQVERDLKRLAPVYRPRELRLIGGEPMLNPYLTDILRVVRAVDFSPVVRMVTNGMLLDRLSDAALGLLDEIEVSRYPDVPVAPEMMDALRKRAKQAGTRIVEARYPEFRATFVRPRSPDPLAEQIFRGCKAGSLWACHAIRDGRFYKCPQSIYVPELAKLPLDEGFDLHAAEHETPRQLFAALWAHLERHERMESCHHCLGTMGQKSPHKLVSRSDWGQEGDAPAEILLDPELLATPVDLQPRQDDCRTVVLPKRPLVRRAAGALRRMLAGPN